MSLINFLSDVFLTFLTIGLYIFMAVGFWVYCCRFIKGLNFIGLAFLTVYRASVYAFLTIMLILTVSKIWQRF